MKIEIVIVIVIARYNEDLYWLNKIPKKYKNNNI